MVFEKVFLIGNGRVADECLRILSKKEVPVEFVEIYTEKFAFTEKMCERLGVPFSHYDKKSIKEFLLGLNEKTLIISAHNSYIFPKDVCDKENLTIVNLHIAYLPEYRGMNPSTWAIYNQESYAGVTWHTVSSKIDNGGIIAQRKVIIDEDDTAMKLMLRCFLEGIKLFGEILDSLLGESFVVFVPDNPNTRLYLGKELPNGGYLDENWDFNKSYAFLRSMDYSGANLMRLPRIRRANSVYEITKYVKAIAEENVEARTEQWLDDRLVLLWNGERFCLICSLRKLQTDLGNPS